MAVEIGYDNLKDVTAPFQEVFTASLDTVFKPPLRGFSCDIDATVVIETDKGDSSAAVFVKAGEIYPALVTQILSAGTTPAVVIAAGR